MVHLGVLLGGDESPDSETYGPLSVDIEVVLYLVRPLHPVPTSIALALSLKSLYLWK